MRRWVGFMIILVVALAAGLAFFIAGALALAGLLAPAIAVAIIGGALLLAGNWLSERDL